MKYRKYTVIDYLVIIAVIFVLSVFGGFFVK